MSKWTEFRDKVVDALNLEEVTEDTKQSFANWCLNKGLPLAEVAADKFVNKCKTDAKNEHGWLYVRDALLFPSLVYGNLWLVKKVLVKTGAQEEQA